jgi:anthranilate synthase/aminodeoxychorismate synthase-like glutamine amidotransferase
MSNILLIDNFDSFTYNLRDYLGVDLAKVSVWKNNDPRLATDEVLDFDGYVLSPGPKTPNDNNLLMSVLERVIYQKPVLGVCLGHQAIGEYFGWDLVHAKSPMHGKVSIVNHQGGRLFNAIPEAFEVCRYHSLILNEGGNKDLRISAMSENQEIMAIEHIVLPIFGVQFHPEAILTQYGQVLISNWLKVVTLHM